MDTAPHLNQALKQQIQKFQEHTELLNKVDGSQFETTRLNALREAEEIVGLLANPRKKLSRCIFMVTGFLDFILLLHSSNISIADTKHVHKIRTRNGHISCPRAKLWISIECLRDHERTSAAF